MSERLYYQDCYLREFNAKVAGISPDGLSVQLDRTAFYPASGGQPHDLGTLAGAVIVDVSGEEDAITHRLEKPAAGLSTGDEIRGVIDWDRRYDHMQQHTGQHLLSAAFVEQLGLATLSFHMGADVSTIELSGATLTAEQIAQVERRANQIVWEARPVAISYEDAQSAAAGLRKASDRTGELRIVSIADLDRSACGGTHVRSTAEAGPIFLRKLDKVRGNVRVEFVCGLRAVRRARTDFDLLTAVARSFSSTIDDTAKLAAAQSERLQDADKALRKANLELAQAKGKSLYDAATPTPTGIRAHIATGAITDETRAVAQSFVTGAKSAFLAVSHDPAAILVAVSKDSGLNAGELVKKAVTARGGRGGGSPQMAQGTIPEAALMQEVQKEIASAWAS